MGLQKGVFNQRHIRKSKIIIKARKPNHVFRSLVGLSIHINTHVTTGMWGMFFYIRRQNPSISSLCTRNRVPYSHSCFNGKKEDPYMRTGLTQSCHRVTARHAYVPVLLRKGPSLQGCFSASLRMIHPCRNDNFISFSHRFCQNGINPPRDEKS